MSAENPHIAQRKKKKVGIRPETFLLLDNSANHLATVMPSDNSNNDDDYNGTGAFLNNVSGQQHRAAWCSFSRSHVCFSEESWFPIRE